MFRFTCFFLGVLIGCILCSPLQSAFEPYPLADIHEGFVSKASGPVEFDAISAAPPQPLNEKIPDQTIQQAMWIPGYWMWAPEVRDHVWISGVWRVPPPGMSWIPGVWHQVDGEGWIWLNGFWSHAPLSELVKSESFPPDPVTQKPGFPDSSNYFWNPGYWQYEEGTKAYSWISGAWELLDPNWVLIPARYQWRPEGYVFIASYWDWPLNRRGVIFTPVTVPKVNRSADYEPVSVLSDAQLHQMLITQYPNYITLCHHIYHYHPDRWATIAPTWWQWHSWWSLPWHNQWALWWWHTHPDYPAPAALTQDIAERIRAANPRLLQMMSDIAPPFIVGQKGVVTPYAIYSVLNKTGKTQVLIMPASFKAADKIKDEAEKEMREQPVAPRKEVEVEPSKRGKLYGVRETVKQTDTSNPEVPERIVQLPPKPVFTPEQPQHAPALKGSPESKLQRVKAPDLNPDIHMVPVNTLKVMRTYNGASDKKPPRPKHIPLPDRSVIETVLPGPRIGPPINHGDEIKSKEPQHPHEDGNAHGHNQG